MSSKPSSGASTPNPRFTSQTKTAEDLLQNQTVGLVALSDFRKRRAEAIEQKERDAHDRMLGGPIGSGAVTPSGSSDGTSTPKEPLKKKKKKAGTPKLSFGVDEEEGDSASGESIDPTSISRSQTSSPRPSKIGANKLMGFVPKPQTKRSLLQESQAREALRKEFMALQERVKNAEIAIPFVFYDGSNIPGGICRAKKGDFVWIFLDKSRKVGAESGAGVNGKEGEGAKARREWARVGVDDLMMVRGEIIIPHHYDFYYFIMNHNMGPNKRLLFEYSADPPSDSATVEEQINLDTYNPLSRPTKDPKPVPMVSINELEGADADPTFTKVVDRRWYERNKHIFPASVWQEFDPEKDYQKEVKRDAGGNAFFFS